MEEKETNKLFEKSKESNQNQMKWVQQKGMFVEKLDADTLLPMGLEEEESEDVIEEPPTAKLGQ